MPYTDPKSALGQLDRMLDRLIPFCIFEEH